MYYLPSIILRMSAGDNSVLKYR